MKSITFIAALFAAGPALAQQSTHYRIESGSFNGSGLPAGGAVAQSSRFVLTLDAAGQAAAGVTLTSPLLISTGGLAGSFPPPGEVQNLHFINASTLQWDAGAYAGDYALYEGTVGSPFDLGYGSCAQPPPALTVNTAPVGTVPAAGQATFYLVTARNRLAQEGGKGFSSAGVQRSNQSPCP